ncbi:hypothetical protein LSH36_611g03050 [Paralvinella palmiformis]|uniref:Uncharacterized protein n=1 Tax=Paralvinella palmiformis TaxID=53620 RepID=A0AAD9J4R7_9ANNE|nr:hypothetical protein LSH36_611g03050 [Paralvinella palmiformis]
MGDFLSGFFWSLGRWQQRHRAFHTSTITVSVTYKKMSKRKHSKDYGEMTIPLLKQELRLESYDRNDNFGHQLVQAEQFNMNVPEQSGYKDINSETQMPTVTEEQVKIYMDLYGQDLKENRKAMYKTKFLRSIRLASQKENVYICGVSLQRCIKNASIMSTSSWIVSVLYNNARCE